MTFSPHFIKGTGGDLFLIKHSSVPDVPCKGQVLVVPPLFEEMNKSRRMLALVSAELRNQGFETIIPDLTGTGESWGDISDATWLGWLDDLDTVHNWMSANSEATPLYILSIRAGCLLANDWLSRRNPLVQREILVQPCPNGKTFITQFMRLRVMANRLAGIDESMADLKEELDGGRSVEIAGYMLAPDLVSGIENSNLLKYCHPVTEGVEFIQISTNNQRELPIPIKKLQAAWVEKVHVRAHVIESEQFWTTQEITAPLNLVQRITASICDH